MWIRMVLLCLIVMFGMQTSRADIMHRVAFKQDPIVVVTLADGAVRSGSVVTVQGEWPRPSAPKPLAGVLEPVSLNAGTSLQADQLFSVASNTGFVIEAVYAGGEVPVGGEIGVTVAQVGARAQAPSRRVWSAPLEAISEPVIVFESPVRTAIETGSVASQSLLLEVTSSGLAEVPVVLQVRVLAE